MAAADPLPEGRHDVAVEFQYDGGGLGKGGTAILTVDGAEVGRERIDETIPVRVSADETLDVGEDFGTPVVRDYDVPFRFGGGLGKVAVDLL